MAKIPRQLLGLTKKALKRLESFICSRGTFVFPSNFEIRISVFDLSLS